MPPPESNLCSNPKEKALIHKWIDQGAKWKDHWAFLPIEKQPLPKIKSKTEARNPIDHFILARLEKEGIQPSPIADPGTTAYAGSTWINGLATISRNY